MKRLHILIALFLLCACTNEVEMPKEISRIVQENPYAYQLNEIWKILDKRYVFFDNMNTDFDELRITYVKRMGDVSSDKQFVQVLRLFLQEFHDPNIILAYENNAYNAYPVTTFDAPARWAGEIASFDAYSGAGKKNTYTDHYILNHLVRHNPNATSDTYGLMVPYSNILVKPDSSFENVIKTYFRGVQGIILDIRNANTSFDATGMLSYFYEPQKHTVCKNCQRNTISKDRNGFAPYTNLTIQGNGILTSMPIVIIINEGTGAEWTWLAHILSERDNVTVVGRGCSGRGCRRLWDTFGSYSNNIIIYPGFLSKTVKGQSCNEPIEPDYLVEKDSEYKANGTTEDKCLTVALNIIDNYNK